jgi:hypothetical protein
LFTSTSSANKKTGMTTLYCEPALAGVAISKKTK